MKLCKVRLSTCTDIWYHFVCDFCTTSRAPKWHDPVAVSLIAENLRISEVAGICGFLLRTYCVMT